MPLVVPAPNAIIDLQEIKAHLNLDPSNTGQDDWLQARINDASHGIEDFLRGPVVEQMFDEIYDGNGKRWLELAKKPIIGLAHGLTSDVGWRSMPDNPWVPLESNILHIFVKSGADELWRLWLWYNIFPVGVQNIRVQYKAGYADIPGDIREACIEIIAERFDESKRGLSRLGQRSRNTGSAGQTGSDTYYELSDRVKELLIPHTFFMP